jgi:hypothetical protein
MSWWEEPVTIYLDHLRTVNELNTSQREHWTTKHKRAKLQRSTTFHWLQHLLPHEPMPWPLKIVLTRISPRALDYDGLVASLKHVVDGVADYLMGAYGTGQDRQPDLFWRYGQRHGKPKEYGVEIILIPLNTQEAARIIQAITMLNDHEHLITDIGKDK